MAMLFDKGKFKYEDPVCKYWPEFGYNGKKNITVADVMRHEAGLSRFDQIVEHESFHTQNMK